MAVEYLGFRTTITRAPDSAITRFSSLLVYVDRVDDADDRGIDRAVFHAGRHPGRAAADDEDRFADSGIDRVHGHQIRAFGLAARIDRPRDHQLVADEPR